MHGLHKDLEKGYLWRVFDPLLRRPCSWSDPFLAVLFVVVVSNALVDGERDRMCNWKRMVKPRMTVDLILKKMEEGSPGLIFALSKMTMSWWYCTDFAAELMARFWIFVCVWGAWNAGTSYIWPTAYLLNCARDAGPSFINTSHVWRINKMI